MYDEHERRRTVSTDLENVVLVDAGEKAAAEPTAATRMMEMERGFMVAIACDVICFA